MNVTQDDLVTTNENVNESIGEIANVNETVEAEGSRSNEVNIFSQLASVSYTHLDVYKRQNLLFIISIFLSLFLFCWSNLLFITSIINAN